MTTDARGADWGIYLVVINREEQYSIWPKDRDIPSGWKPIGKEGSRSDCLDFINNVWTDMAPKGLQGRH
jgi:MbtH protein